MAIADVISSSSEKVESSTSGITGQSKKVSFPSNIENNTAHSSYLVFSVVKPMLQGDLSASSLSKRQEDQLGGATQIQTEAHIRLYMPSNIKQSVNHKYAQGEMELWTELGSTFLQSEGDGVMEKLKNSYPKMQNIVVDRMLQELGGQQAVTQNLGKIVKQRASLMYNGTALRTQKLTFDLRASNLTELKAIGEIVWMFNYYSSGTKSDFTGEMQTALESTIGANYGFNHQSYGVINVPPIWFVEERPNGAMKPRFTDRFVFGPAVISNVTVDKTPESMYQVIAGTAGDPVAIKLELTLNEMVPVYSDYWRQIKAYRNGLNSSLS